VKTEIISLISNRTLPTASVYSPENSFYIIVFPDQLTAYCFDLKGKLENGAYRVTRWTSIPHKSFEVKTDGTVYIGTVDGIGTYSGYVDNTTAYRFRYYSPGLTFGDPAKTKLLKKLRPTLVGATGATVFMKWSYDLATDFKTYEFTVGNQVPAYYGVDEFAIGEFTGGELTTRNSVQATGNGSIITIGLEADIYGSALSLQEINVLALMGKTV